MNYYLSVLKNYAVFSGRASRSEYWYFILFNMIISIVISFAAGSVLSLGSVMIPSIIYMLAVLLPGLGVSVRRMHDIGKNGWTVLLNLIPLVGPIWFVVLAAHDGDTGENKYGSKSKGLAVS